MKIRLILAALALALPYATSAQTAATSANDKFLMYSPAVQNCLGILEFESLNADSDTGKFSSMRTDQVSLYGRYMEFAGWLEAYVSMRNETAIGGDLMHGIRSAQWMTWLYSYCRAHPTDNYLSAANALVAAFSGGK